MAGQSNRDRGKEQFWRRTLRQWRRSGLSVRAYCAEHGLAEPSFYAWRRIVAERDQESARVRAKPAGGGVRREAPAGSDAPVFVPLRVIDASTQQVTLEVVLERGRVVRVLRGFDTETLRRLLALLEEERPC
jgi:transposase-like protein